MEVALMSIVLVGSLLTCKGGTHGQGRPLEGKDDHSLRQRICRTSYRLCVTDNSVNKVFDEMLMFVHVLRFMYIPCTASSGLAGLYTDDGVFVAIPRRDQNSMP
ncbi:hypothetical protein B296_00041878 [Ensete ventricosum]|uniref:Secreted protein n=1 Tax=Ensete ventricosum TaxID=4639 RepID=A0A426XDS8_ENSVE|nr:hypothetical protein B296_00041878 [Ensete ventricosum]